MRFLCDNCKAKYQIADEKVAGREVRMKCRKCGHLIHVPAASAPGSQVTPSPAAPEPKPAAAPARAAEAAGRAAAPPRPGSAPLASGARPAAAAPHPPGGGLARPAARPAPPPAPKPARPAPPAAAKPAAGALAGAFAKAVKEGDDEHVAAAIEVLSAGASEEWYVGVNGVPLGPVRLSTLRHKAAQGVVGEESLVWREGFEEWLPLRTFPELVVLVQEARSGGVRSSAVPPPPQAQRISAVPSGPITGRAPLRAPAPPARAGMIPAPPRAAPGALAAPASAGAMRPLGPGAGAAQADVLAAQAAEADAFAAGELAAAEVMADPFAADPMGGGAVAAAIAPGVPGPISIMDRSGAGVESAGRPTFVDEVALGVRRQVRMHPLAWVMIALAGGFGATAAVVLLVRSPMPAPPPTIQIVTVTAPPTAVPGGPPAAGSAVEAPGATAGTARVGGVAVAAGGTKPGEKPPPDTKTPPAATPGQLTGLGDMPGLPGPAVGGPRVGSDNTNLPALEQGDIERVVASNRGLVKRQCWEPALASRSGTAPNTAKVNVSITIGSDGRVQGASASGGAGYPDLASCVAARVKNWKFPPSSGTSQASVPFVFAAQ